VLYLLYCRKSKVVLFLLFVRRRLFRRTWLCFDHKMMRVILIFITRCTFYFNVLWGRVAGSDMYVCEPVS